MIYLDNASTTPVDLDLIDIIKIDLLENWGNPSNLYNIGKKSKKIIEESRKKIADALNCEPDEIYFTSGSSEGNAWALRQRARCFCSPYEHHNIINNSNSTVIDIDYLEKSVFLKKANDIFFSENMKNFIYSHMLVNNITGEIFNILKPSEMAHELGMLFHCDMTQALGNFPIDFQKEVYKNVDVATFTGHKIGVPKGIGFNYFNKRSFEEKGIEPLIYGGGQEKSVRAGTENIPYIHALGYAVERAVNNYRLKDSYCKKLKALLLEELIQTDIDFIVVSPADSISSTLTICIKDVNSEVIMDMLSEKSIYIGVGSACNSGLFEEDSVLVAMEIPEKYINGLIRISFSMRNIEEEIKTFVKELNYIYSCFR